MTSGPFGGANGQVGVEVSTLLPYLGPKPPFAFSALAALIGCTCIQYSCFAFNL